MRIVAIVLFTVLIGSLWIDATVNQAEAGCYERKWKGRHCMAVHYEIAVDSLGEAQERIQEQLNIFKQIADKEELGMVRVETEKFNITSGQQSSNSWGTIDGWVLYELSSPKHAVKFMDALTIEGYETMQHEQRPGCKPPFGSNF